MADKANKEVAEEKAAKKQEETAVAEMTTEETQTEETKKPAKEVSLKESNPEKFLKEFNWHNYEEGIDPIDDGKLEEFEKLVAENFVDTLMMRLLKEKWFTLQTVMQSLTLTRKVKVLFR